MDELELLKKDWKKQDNSYPKLSYDEIYKMILKKSSSIVKWIFIISLLEFVFWFVISFALKDTDAMEHYKKFDADAVLIPLAIIGYVILAYFFYLFYRNYRRISATDSAKTLMENILKTRRSVKYYVGFNLFYLVLSTVLFLWLEFDQDTIMINKVNEAAANGEAFKLYAVIILTTIVLLAIVIALLLGFYWLVYGILLKRLNHNYKELKKLEV
ncbi:MAG: hypothetical protein R2802_00715 [Flavobacteriaceae bacterium]|nr:hypothetical protein [Mangrovimonas sp.]MCB0437961.1 hypothetical protein [Mangrovimonas sp.]HRV55884.1 hypothetical protein [Mangrovimonas sp.]